MKPTSATTQGTKATAPHFVIAHRPEAERNRAHLPRIRLI
jgi:hypothetical protein